MLDLDLAAEAEPEAGRSWRRGHLLNVAADLQQELGHVRLFDGFVVTVVDAALQGERLVFARAQTLLIVRRYLAASRKNN